MPRCRGNFRSINGKCTIAYHHNDECSPDCPHYIEEELQKSCSIIFEEYVCWFYPDLMTLVVMYGSFQNWLEGGPLVFTIENDYHLVNSVYDALNAGVPDRVNLDIKNAVMRQQR